MSNVVFAYCTELLHRTDFFPGLGWMLLRATWLELRHNWPAVYVSDNLSCGRYLLNLAAGDDRTCSMCRNV